METSTPKNNRPRYLLTKNEIIAASAVIMTGGIALGLSFGYMWGGDATAKILLNPPK